ncbi:hypothetical protein Hamer_G030201 [Homarus americanus]|uniref:Uncharacterized protein n=1 Tax=Homarus americanus TaxID=6706 RepID=A0A8J5MPF1_HOMAM|nr:hypothetical protein Hamer_G030201 [Homarus americanus]
MNNFLFGELTANLAHKAAQHAIWKRCYDDDTVKIDRLVERGAGQPASYSSRDVIVQSERELDRLDDRRRLKKEARQRPGPHSLAGNTLYTSRQRPSTSSTSGHRPQYLTAGNAPVPPPLAGSPRYLLHWQATVPPPLAGNVPSASHWEASPVHLLHWQDVRPPTLAGNVPHASFTSRQRPQYLSSTSSNAPSTSST